MDFRRLKWNKWALAAVLALLVLSLGVRKAVTARSSGPDSLDGNISIFEVEQGPLTISVSCSGTIKAREQEVIKCEVEGQTTILSIIPEGERVQRGDLLIELDASRLQDERVDQEIRVQNAEAAFISAREQLEVVKNQATSDVDKAKLELQFAEEDLKNFVAGEFPKQLKEADARVTLSKGTRTRAVERVEGSERLAERNFITRTELEADRQDALKAQLDLELAEDEKQLLTDFTYKRELAQLESDARQADMALERTQRKASADVVQAEADLKAKESEYIRQKSKLEKIEEQIAKTQVYAPADGLVVYATSSQGSWRGNAEPLAEGQEVRERQELIHLPTGSSFMAEVDVHEASLTKIKQGLPVYITVEALPGSSFQGEVVSVAPLPDAQSVWMNPDLKVYNTDIDIEGDATGLRTGMTCLAEIIVEEYDDAVYVPVQAVVRVGGRPTVYLAKGKKAEAREVELGLDNNRMVRILVGLTPGERVLLTPPLKEDKGENGERERRRAGEDAGRDGGQPPSSDTPAVEASPGRGEGDGPRDRQRGGDRGGPPDGVREGPRGDDSEGPRERTRGDDSEGPRGDDMRERFRNASPEERERMRKEFEERMQNLSPEEREQMMERRGRRRSRESSGADPGAS